VGYVGRLANEKRVADLKVLNDDPRIQLVIVGDGPAREKLQRELDNAIFTGFMCGTDLAQAYASLDLFIHTGPNETFCQAVQEALASGVPCIVPATGGPADLVTQGATGYIIDTKSPSTLLKAVEDFMGRSDRSDMNLMARNSVVERTWDRVNSQLVHHYEEVIFQNANSSESERVA
jgi:phosphatidylinositol alpha 1,6-mannosyltransferase